MNSITATSLDRKAIFDDLAIKEYINKFPKHNSRVHLILINLLDDSLTNEKSLDRLIVLLKTDVYENNNNIKIFFDKIKKKNLSPESKKIALEMIKRSCEYGAGYCLTRLLYNYVTKKYKLTDEHLYHKHYWCDMDRPRHYAHTEFLKDHALEVVENETAGYMGYTLYKLPRKHYEDVLIVKGDQIVDPNENYFDD